MNLHSYAFRLFLIAKIDPRIWDSLIPMAPKYLAGTQNVITGQIVKAVSKFTGDVVLKEEVYALGQLLYSSGTKHMDYDDDFFVVEILEYRYLICFLLEYRKTFSIPRFTK